jgi:hypothetical protein
VGVEPIRAEEYRDAVTLNPSLVYAKLEEIIDQQYLIKKETKQIILSNATLIDKFVTIHIEFENGLASKSQKQNGLHTGLFGFSEEENNTVEIRRVRRIILACCTAKRIGIKEI